MVDRARTVALFPGAFRPPHANHHATVRYLAERHDVDEVVVIIANRARPVPTTSKVLDVDLAERIWALYLRGTPNVRVEVAAAGAVAHALGYVDRALAGDEILLVVGRKEAAEGRHRFGKLRAREPKPGVRVTVVEGADDLVTLSATRLRSCLAAGEAGRAEFLEGLPAHLSRQERQRVWSLCRGSMVEQGEVSIKAIRGALDRHHLQAAGAIEPVRSGKLDPVYHVELAHGARCFVKHANDTVAADGLAGGGRKPRRRLKVEREAIKWTRRNVESPVLVPEVLVHDKVTKTLALSDVLEGGCRLTDALVGGIFDPRIGVSVARFLAEAHCATAPVEPFWDDRERDLAHWRLMLGNRTTEIDVGAAFDGLRPRLEQLRASSDAARTPGFRHLDLTTHNLVVRGPDVGVIDFEMSSTVGDPAYDLGVLLGDYLHCGLQSGVEGRCRAVLLAIVRSYEARVGARWQAMAARTVAFAGASLLHQLTRPSGRLPDPVSGRGVQLAAHLLSIDLDTNGAQVSDALGRALERNGSSAEAPLAPTLRRRSLQSSDPRESWEGSVTRYDDRHDLTLEILGGDPRAPVEIHVDGSRIVAVSLDALGAAHLTVGPGRAISVIEVRTDSGTVLDGLVPLHPTEA